MRRLQTLQRTVLHLGLCCLAFHASPASAQAVAREPGLTCNAQVGSDYSITGQASSPDTTGNPSTTGNNLICDGSYWQYPALIAGSISAGGTAISCATGTAGAIEWTGSALQYCNGTSWTALGGGGSLSGGTTNYTARWTSSTALGIGTLYDNGTQVGIGTTSPANPLQIVGTSNYGIEEIVGNGTNVESSLGFRSSNVSKGVTGDWAAGVNLTGTPTNSFSVYNGGIPGTAFLITSASNVGIGTTSPQAQLHVAGGVIIGTDTATCTSAKTGEVHYNASTTYMEYCNGSAWNPFEQPQCSTGSTAACWLPATRSGGDTNFTAANIASGVSILGVTGTYSGGSGCDVQANLSFTALGLKSVSTLYTSNIVQVTTASCSAPVTVSGSGSPQFRICSDSACGTVIQTWGATAQTISNGQYVQLEATSSAAYATAVTPNVVLGSAYAPWSIATMGNPASGKFVFVTSTGYAGNLKTEGGGSTAVAGANALCAARATAAGLSGTYLAWLSTSTSLEPAVTFTQASIPYQLLSGTQIAANWSGLISGTLSHAINLTELGGTVGTESVWSGTTSSGTYNSISGSICTAYTTAVGTGSSSGGMYGNTSDTNSGWSLDTTVTSYNCAGSYPLYCFQQ